MTSFFDFQLFGASGEKVDSDMGSVADAIAMQSHRDKFSNFLRRAQLINTLHGKGPFTVLCPSDDAFRALDEPVFEAIRFAETVAHLQQVMLNHMVFGILDVDAMRSKLRRAMGGAVLIQTISGKTLTLGVQGRKLTLQAPHAAPFVVGVNEDRCANGIIHDIDTVIL